MARSPSGDRPGNGTLKGLQKIAVPASGPLKDEQTLADTDQTLADTDQTMSDGDQTAADRDQSSSERDQVAADRDQAASDRDLAHGVDPLEHELTRDIRQRTTREREQTASARLDTATARDASANARDLSALIRDQAADARDLAMAQRDTVDEEELARGRAVTGAQIVMRASDQRKRAARYRAQAAEHRMRGAEDRDAAARDREQCARDRLQALADREALAQQLARSETDALTGARTRLAGLKDLDHELDRCRRTSMPLIVGYIDIVGLKAVNDGDGHAAGDALLTRVVMHIRAQVRSYDLIIRLGGDEFLCAMPGITLAEARKRFSDVAGELAASAGAGAIRTGFAQLADEDSATELIGRADDELVSRGR